MTQVWIFGASVSFAMSSSTGFLLLRLRSTLIHIEGNDDLKKALT